MTATTGYARVNGLDMYYEVHGEGDPLVLLHAGMITIGLSFGTLLPRLAERRRVIAVELQGHGHTPDIDREPTVEHHSADVLALLDHLGVARADLFGYSLGGLVALQTAITRPERVGRLVLAAVHAWPEGYHEEILAPDARPGVGRMPTEGDFRAMERAYRRVAPDPGHFEAFMARQSAVVGAFPGWKPAELRALAAPTLLVIGDRDFVRVEHAEEMRRLIPDARLAVLPGATHMDVTRHPALPPMLAEFL